MIHPQPTNICAVIVTYHPDDCLAERVEAIAEQVSSVVIVDNGSEPEARERICALSLPCAYHCILNEDNRGIATALNQGIAWAQSQGFAWVLTFDQDSQISDGFTASLIQVYDACPDKAVLAIVGANYTHAGQNLSGYPASDLTYGGGDGWREVVMAITSGSLMSLEAYARIGPFMDALFIDHVDTEYCLRARAKGFHIVVTDAPLMVHSVGQLTPRRMLGRQVWTFNYSPLRWYYRTRNHIYLLRRYLRQEPRWLGRTVNDLIRGWVKLILFESQRTRKAAAVARGIRHGLFLRRDGAERMTHSLVSPDADTQANPPPTAFSRGAWWLWRHFPLLNFALLALCVFRYAVAIPILDQWALVPLLDKMYRHRLAFADLWAQHNEHRLVFPRLIMLACARLSGWDLRWELAVNLLLGAGIYAAFAYQARQTARIAGVSAFRRLPPLFALIAFSFRQFENWEWGWQLQIFLNVLAVVGGIIALTGRPFSWMRLTGAMACGVVATYSFANGMLFWVVGGAAILCVPRDGRRLLYLAAWLVVASAVIASYRYQFEDNPIMRASLAYGLRHPLAFGIYVVSYLGSLFSIGNLEARPYWSLYAAATPAGLFGLGALWWVAAALSGAAASDRETLLPYAAMVLYACLSALVSAAGRLSIGVVQATSSRYTTISQLFWVGLLALALLAIEPQNANSHIPADVALQDENGASKARPIPVTPDNNAPEQFTLSAPVKRLFLAAAIALAFFSLASMPRLQRHYAAMRRAERELDRNPANAPDIHPDAGYLLQQQATLRQLHLNIYRVRNSTKTR